MKVFVAGGSGFVGRNLIRELLNQGHQVRALIRNATTPLPDEAESVIGDTTRYETLAGAAEGCTAIINLVGIIREFPSKQITFERLHTASTSNLIRLASESGIHRFLQMSANGTRDHAVTAYHRTKWAAEEHLRQSSLDWTIFRPSLIYGPDDLFINMLAGLIKSLPVVPVMGNGKYRLQPVHVEDIARSFVQALQRTETIGQTYHCCGPEQLSYNDILDLIGTTLGRKRSVCKIHHPLGLMKPIISVLQYSALFPITSDQLTMLLEENICSDSTWKQTFALELKDLAQGIAAYLK